MRIKLHSTDPVAFIKRAYKLAYEACGGPFGYGILQARSQASEEDIFKNVCMAGDYPCRHEPDPEKTQKFYGDYVFGRMMKLGMRVIDGQVEINDAWGWTPDYNAFAFKYPNAASLAKATLLSLGEREDSFTVVEEPLK